MGGESVSKRTAVYMLLSFSVIYLLHIPDFDEYERLDDWKTMQS
jgi:hypothetical protein